MKGNVLHGRVWLTTLGRDCIVGWSSGCGGKGDDDGLMWEEVKVLRGRKERERERRTRGESPRDCADVKLNCAQLRWKIRDHSASPRTKITTNDLIFNINFYVYPTQ